MLAGACGGTDDRLAAWEYISPAILQPSCATGSCHSSGAAVSGLDLSDPDRGYTSLTRLWVWIIDPQGTPEDGCRAFEGIVACQRNHRPLVTPYDPAQSRLVNMLRARNAPRMPPDRVLPEADIALVERWILNGARRTINDPPPSRDAGTRDAPADATDASGISADARSDGDGSDARTLDVDAADNTRDGGAASDAATTDAGAGARS